MIRNVKLLGNVDPFLKENDAARPGREGRKGGASANLTTKSLDASVKCKAAASAEVRRGEVR